MQKRSPLLPIFLTVFLDMLGVGIIIPVIPALFVSADSSILPAATTLTERSVLYGYLIAIYPLMQFFGAPVLGALSDRYGRRPMLVISLIGTMIGYILFGWAILIHNLPLLFLSRALPGFTGGNISIVYSAISDLTVDQPQTRPKYFGLVGMAFGLGFILGPALGGLLADNSVVSWFDHSTPFWFTSALTFANLLLLWRVFPETLRQPRQTAINLLSGVSNIRKAFSSPNLRGIFKVSLLLSLGFSFFTQFFAVYLMQRFGMKEKDIGLIFGWVGIWLVFTQGVTVRYLSRKVESRQILRYSILLLSISVPLVLLPENPWNVLWINPLIATFQGVTSPNLTTVVSAQASTQEQGEILGINQSMISVGQMVPPLIAGYLNSLNGAYPILAGGIAIFLGWLAYISLQLNKAKNAGNEEEK
ncbi:MAG: MFS transporter [Bacteroidetes bacterium]|nr:MAG: MFS transporter [Bacteroidota bacterium]